MRNSFFAGHVPVKHMQFAAGIAEDYPAWAADYTAVVGSIPAAVAPNPVAGCRVEAGYKEAVDPTVAAGWDNRMEAEVEVVVAAGAVVPPNSWYFRSYRKTCFRIQPVPRTWDKDISVA